MRDSPAVQAAERLDQLDGPTADSAKRDSAKRARSRAFSRCRELMICNSESLKYFVTLTLSPEYCNRFDYKEIVSKLGRKLGNLCNNYGFKYILVPELHPTSGAYHFHGFFSSDGLHLIDSGKKTAAGAVIYNIRNFGSVGWNTCVSLDGCAAAINYCLKYVKKADTECKGRYFFHGGKLRGYIRECYNIDLAALQLEKLRSWQPDNCNFTFYDVTEVFKSGNIKKLCEG